MSSARAQTTEPTANAASDHSSMRRRPYRSPSGPASGSATTVASRKPVINQVTEVGDASRRTWISGSAGVIAC